MTSPRKLEITKKLKSIIAKFSKIKIMVIGDLMWDEYIYGSTSRISPEAPVPVIRLEKEYKVPGGAANVLKNLYDLKVNAAIMGVVGSDKYGREMIKEFHRWNLSYVGIWESGDRPTILKTRIIARNQQLLRLDREEVVAINVNLEKKILDNFSRQIKNYDGVILSDYAKGLLTPTLLPKLISIANKHNVLTVVDPQVANFKYYKNASILTPNEKEASEGMQMSFPMEENEVKSLGFKIKEKLNLQHLLITRSEKGIALFADDKPPVYVPTVAREVFDVSGAGDAVSAVLTVAMCAGATPLEATTLANIAGGIVVNKLGTASVLKKELLFNLTSD